uniref:Odorant-binding protein 8 n=1 Tax=Eocanthecona furcellata TaxID=696902 RepID=A0AAT9TZ71_9HEMI
MKFFTVVVLTLVIFTTSLVLIECQEDEVMKLQKEAMTQCTEEHPISQEAIKSIVNREHVPDDPEVKCWIRCAYEKLGVMKDGKLDWDRCNFLTKHCLDNDEDKAKVDRITEICRLEVSNDEEDKCQLAYIGTVCKIDNWKKLGLPAMKLIER